MQYKGNTGFLKNISDWGHRGLKLIITAPCSWKSWHLRIWSNPSKKSLSQTISSSPKHIPGFREALFHSQYIRLLGKKLPKPRPQVATSFSKHVSGFYKELCSTSITTASMMALTDEAEPQHNTSNLTLLAELCSSQEENWTFMADLASMLVVIL